MSAISEHIGSRIRLYRKNKRMTLEEFSKMLHKSKSTVSKYEKGDISIDIETLYEIAAALRLDIRQLLDITASENMPKQLTSSGFFAKCNRYYTYYLNKNSTRIIRGILDIFGDAEEHSSVYYVDLKDYDSLSQCRHLYYGDIHYSDSFVNLVMQNQDNESERIFLNVINTFGRGNITVGMLSGTSSKYMVPLALKVVISHVRIEENDELLEALKFSRKDIALMKRAYCFTVDRMFELLDG